MGLRNIPSTGAESVRTTSPMADMFASALRTGRVVRFHPPTKKSLAPEHEFSQYTAIYYNRGILNHIRYLGPGLSVPFLEAIISRRFA